MNGIPIELTCIAWFLGDLIITRRTERRRHNRKAQP